MSDIDLNVYLRIVWRWSWLILASVVLAAFTSYYATRAMPRVYLSSAALVVGDETVQSRVSLDDISASQRVAAVYAGMARRQPVLDAVVRALDLPFDWRHLQTKVLTIRRDGSQLLEIRVTDTDPERARDITDEIARQLVLQSPTIQETQQQQQRRDFLGRQISALQANIVQAEATLTDRQAALAREVSARSVLELQDQISALDLKLNNWRTTYASLLTSYEGRSPNNLSVVEPAYVPVAPISPNVRASVLMASVVALVLSVGTVLLIEFALNADRLAGPEDVTRTTGLATLATPQSFGRLRSPAAGLVALRAPHSAHAEAYRVLRTNIRFACRDDSPLMLLVTSPGPGEGKTLTSANLAVSFAQAGKRTVLVDADLRQPTLHTLFGAANERGMTTLLGDAMTPESASLERWLLTTDQPNLRLLPAGSLPAGSLPAVGPGELLASPAMEWLLAALRGAADVVVVDCPPVLPVADVAILAEQGLVSVLVLQAGRTRGAHAANAIAALQRAGATIVGVVVNRSPREAAPQYRYERVAARLARPFWARTGA